VTRRRDKNRTSRHSRGQRHQNMSPPQPLLKGGIRRPALHSRLSLVIVPGFPSHNPLSRIPRSPDGSPGVYKVTYVLSVPGQTSFHDELDVNVLMQSGNSLLESRRCRDSRACALISVTPLIHYSPESP
jgi:hypothetical protein